MLASDKTLAPATLQSRMNSCWRTPVGEGAPSRAQNDLICIRCLVHFNIVQRCRSAAVRVVARGWANYGSCRNAPIVRVERAGSCAQPASQCSTVGARLVWGYWPKTAVNPLAEQVGVAEVAGVLLAHVGDHLAQRGGGAIF